MQNMRWWDAAAVAVTVVIVAVSLIDPPFGVDDAATWAAAGAFLLVHLTWGRRCVPVGDDPPPSGGRDRLRRTPGDRHHSSRRSRSCRPSSTRSSGSTSPSTRSAIVANLLIAVAIVVGYAIRRVAAGLVTGAAVAALSVGFSIALGLWITRIAVYGEERARLLEELQAAQGQLAAMHRDAGVAEERGRLAREIHDTIAQSLTGLVMVAQRTERRLAAVEGEAAASARGEVELMEQIAREALTEARGLVASLAPVDSSAGLARRCGDSRRASSARPACGSRSRRTSRASTANSRSCCCGARRRGSRTCASTRRAARVAVTARDGEVVLDVATTASARAGGTGRGRVRPGRHARPRRARRRTARVRAGRRRRHRAARDRAPSGCRDRRRMPRPGATRRQPRGTLSAWRPSHPRGGRRRPPHRARGHRRAARIASPASR